MTRVGIVRIGIVTTVLTLGAVGCAPVRVHSYMPPGVHLTEYRTYGWATSQTRDTGDVRLDDNRFFFERIENEVDRRLAERGLEKTDRTPNLLVHVHANISQRVEGPTGARDGDACRAGECGSYVYDAGTLTLDVADARTGMLVWRGWSNETFDGAIDDQQLMNGKIADAIARIVRQMPRPGS